MIPFGERIWFRRLSASGDRKRAMESKWEEGLWLGHSRDSNEAIVGNKDGVNKAWSVRRRIPAERWSEPMVSERRGVPSD